MYSFKLIPRQNSLNRASFKIFYLVESCSLKPAASLCLKQQHILYFQRGKPLKQNGPSK